MIYAIKTWARPLAATILVVAITTTPDFTQASDLTVLAVGDTGKGNAGQMKIGQVMSEDCRKEACEFVLLLGDNIYDVGINSPTDPQMIDKFEKPYASMGVPFYVALGNHDYGKFANDWKKGDHQVEYSRRNPNFILPSHYYSFEKGDVLFIVLDTSRLFHDKDTAEQVQFIRDTLAKNTKPWIVAIAHHPYLSNGKHGNAGQYDGVIIPPYSGSVVKKVVEKEICPYAQLMISGHEHSLQTLPGNAACPKTLFVVSGGGASPSNNLKGKNPVHFQAAVLGFTRLKFAKNQVLVTHVGEDGKNLHSIYHPVK